MQNIAITTAPAAAATTAAAATGNGEGGGRQRGQWQWQRHTVFLFFIQSASAVDPPCVFQKMGNERKLNNAIGKWDLVKANLHM